MRFGGRDTRSQFWPYAAAAVALYLIVGMPVGIIMLPDDPGTSLKAVDHFILASVLTFAGLVALLAAAVARRLHDGGFSAFWGLLPLPFVAYSITMFVRLASQFETGEPDAQLFFIVFTTNVLYFVALVWLIVLLARRSVSGPNRFG